MPLIIWPLAIALGGSSLALGVSVVGREVRDTTQKTGTDLILIGAAGLGLYAAYKALAR